MVGVRGFEPPWVAPPDPKSGASANSATRPNLLIKNSPPSRDASALRVVDQFRHSRLIDFKGLFDIRSNTTNSECSRIAADVQNFHA